MAFITIQTEYEDFQQVLEFASYIRVDRNNEKWVRVRSYDPDSDTLYCSDDEGNEYEFDLASENFNYEDVMICCLVDVEQEENELA